MLSNFKYSNRQADLDEDPVESMRGSLDQFNLSSSGRLNVLSLSESRKFAQIDHFKSDTIDQKEQEVIEKLAHGVRDAVTASQQDAQPSRGQTPPRPRSATKSLKVTKTIEEVSEGETDSKMDMTNKPKFPGFEDELREIREHYAKEYEERMKRGLQELTEIKKDIASKQEFFDSKQVKELRREVKRVEDEMIDLKTQNFDLKKTIENLRLVIKEKEISFEKINGAVNSKDNSNATLKEQLKERDLQIEAMMVKLDMFKKNIEEMNFKYSESQKLLDQMRSQDFAKQNLILKRQTMELTDSLALKQKYLDDLKNNMKMAMQSISNTHDHEQQSAIFSNLLENLSQENVRSRRLIEELQKRESICQRKWNKLLQENLDLQDKINGHNMQLQKTREQYQFIVQQNERKLLEANQRLAWLQNSDDKKAAAEYLVDQMRIVNEEKQGLLQENQAMQQQISDVQFEYQTLERDLKDFMCFRQNSDFHGFTINQDPIAQNTHRLVQRVEELEDLVVELKSKQSASEMVELKQLVSQLQLENLGLIKQLKNLHAKRVSSKDLFDKNEMHSSYLCIMKEREKIIEQLQKQLKRVADHKILNAKNYEQSFGGTNPYHTGRHSSASSNAKATYGISNKEITHEQSDFEEEKLKDAMHFKMLGEHQTHQTEDRQVVQQSSRGMLETVAEQHPAMRQSTFANFSRKEKDEWLLTSDQQ